VGFDSMFYYFRYRYERKVRYWVIIRELTFIEGGFLEQWRNDRFFDLK